ncbi:tetratricopeptide repeat-containing sensor histidine kinase [Seonamhaeicola marinus]|uniref:tetratricopeptide repeat-containing sensor histidine kinase n=1 Tax=Seonamhaeicola marinus TaxID=1912246 RepID=UPI001651B522|nr:sensor histidine kinase [Seonamhaeicola marinus]
MIAIDLSKKNNDFLLDGGYYFMGLYHRDIGEINKAKESYKKAIQLVDSVANKQKFAQILSAYANLLSGTDELDEQISYFTRALKIKESIGDKSKIAITQYNFSNVYRHAGIDTLAIDYLKRAMSNAEASGQKGLKAHILNNLTIFALKNNELEKANTYLMESEKICKEIGSNLLCFNTFLQKGRYLDKLKKIGEAEAAFFTSLEYAKKRGVPQDIMLAHTYLGKHYELFNNPKKAILNFKKAQEQDPANAERIMSPFSYMSWSRAESKLGNYKKSNEYLQKHVKIMDSLSSEKNKKSLANAEAKYQTAKKDKEIATKQLEIKEKETEIQKEKAQNNYMLGAIVFLTIATILLVVLFKQRQKRKNQELLTLRREFQIKTLESLIEGEEKERHRVARELHDGVNGDLAAIKYKLSTLLEMNNNVIKEAITMIDDSCKQVRAISHNLIPPSLENFNLLEATQVYCSNLNEVTQNLEITFQHLGETIEIPKKAEVNAFRIIQELVTNAIRHAEASQIDVQISSRDNAIQITVEDDGKGFDKNNVKSDGIGLSNVQSRVDYLNATTDFISNNQGTSYTIDIDKDKVNGN